ncbi:MAG: NAD-dependent epimerase/dehydratase family protein [Tabrizicola sp.]
MRFLVLGGCGFIGSHVVDQLVLAGHDVRIVSRRPEAARGPVQGVEYVFGDCRDAGLLATSLDGIDGVLHMFSATTPGSGNLDPKNDVEQNLLSALTLLEEMCRAGVRRLVYLSSGGTVYGHPESIPIPESHPLRPIGSYGIVKVAVESYIGLYARERGLLPAIIRPSNTYGERQGRNGAHGVVSVLMRRALAGSEFQVWGDGSLVRDYLYVGDLARLCRLAAESSLVGTFNAGSGHGTSLQTLIDHVMRISGRSFPVNCGDARTVDVPVNVLDVALAADSLGWVPETPMQEGLRLTWDWHRQYWPTE